MTAPGPNRRRRKEARPAEIVAAALDVFGERGYSRTRIDDVAARAGVSKGTVYLYFPNKEELFRAVVGEALLPNLARAEALAAAYPGPSAELLARLLTIVSGLVADSRIRAIPRLVIAEAAHFPEIAQFYLDSVVRRGLALVRSILERGVTRGEFRPMDLDHVAKLVIAPLLLSAVWKSLFDPYDPKPLDPEALFRSHIDLLLGGLLVREDVP